MESKRTWPLIVGAATLAGCGNPADFEAIKSGQKDILAKLEGLEKKIGEIKAAPAAPSRPSIDPNKVYAIPTDGSPFKGPKAAKVAIVEFSDFQ